MTYEEVYCITVVALYQSLTMLPSCDEVRDWGWNVIFPVLSPQHRELHNELSQCVTSQSYCKYSISCDLLWLGEFFKRWILNIFQRFVCPITSWARHLQTGSPFLGLYAYHSAMEEELDTLAAEKLHLSSLNVLICSLVLLLGTTKTCLESSSSTL